MNKRVSYQNLQQKAATMAKEITVVMSQENIEKIRDMLFDLYVWLEDPKSIDWSSITPTQVEELYLIMAKLAKKKYAPIHQRGGKRKKVEAEV